MKYWKKAMLIGIAACSLLVGNIAAYAGSAKTELSVYINGRLHGDVFQKQNRTFVQLAALNDPDWTLNYEAKTKTVVIASNSLKKTIKLKQGQKTADVNGKPKTLDAPAVMKDGRTYVPLRFVSEELNGYVSYKKEQNRVIIRTPEGQRDYAKLLSGNLAEAREVAVGLEMVYDDSFTELPVTGEGFTTTHTFPRGEALRLVREYKGMTWYAEVNEDGLLAVKWQKDSLADKKEAGVPPKPFEEAVVYSQNLMSELLMYGTIDDNGEYTEIGRIDQSQPGAYQHARVVPIEGEERTDVANTAERLNRISTN